MRLYALRDSKVGFNAPYVQPNDDVAIRTFGKVAKESDIAEDLELWYIGDMDETNGELKFTNPKFMKGGAEYVHITQ